MSEPTPPTLHGRGPSAALVDQHARAELLDVAAHTGVFAGWLTVGAVAFTGFLLFERNPPLPLSAWAGVAVLVSLARVAACWRWLRARVAGPRGDRVGPPPAMPVLRLWERVHALIGFCCGLAWAALVAVTADPGERTTLLVAFMLTIAVVVAGSFFATHRFTNVLFALPIVVAQGFNLQRLSLDQHALVDLAWLCLVVALYFMPRNASRALRAVLVARIDQEWRASEQTALLETAPIGILVVRDGRIVVCNDAVLRLLGYQRKDDLLGRSVRLVMPDDDVWQRLNDDAKLALKGPLAPRIVQRRRRDGSLIDLMRNVAAVRLASGETEFIGTYEDVRERVAIEEGYQHTIRMQRLVFESAGEGIAIVSDGVVEQANQALSDLIGWPIAQITGRTLQSIFEDPHGWSEIERRFQQLGNTLKLERRIVHSDGRAIWVNVTGCLVDAPGKRVDGETLTGAPKRSIWILADLSVQKRKEAENWHHANHDVMTGLPNRRFLQDRLDQALASARRDGRRVAVLELDLDGFKSVNDTYGHRFGDAVLEEVARRLSTVVRELDTVGRWGGDEFVLVLKEIESREIVEETVKRVIARLTEPIVFQGQHLSVGASIGIALFPDHGDEVEALMLAADLAMYESKAGGGNTWRFSSQTATAPRGKYRPANDPAPATNP